MHFGFDAFQKMKRIFSIAPVESLEKSWEWNAVLGDIRRSIRRCIGRALWVQCLALTGVYTPDPLTVTWASPVVCVRWFTAEAFAALDVGERPVTLREKHPLCVRVRCVPDASGGYLTASDGLKVTVRDWHVIFKRVTLGWHLRIGRRVLTSSGSLLCVRCPRLCPVEEPTALFVERAYK